MFFSKIKELLTYLDKKTKYLLLACVFTGLSSALIEYLFVTVLQNFLILFDIMKGEFNSDFAHLFTVKNITIFLITVSFIRVSVEAAKVFVSRFTQQSYGNHLRKKIIKNVMFTDTPLNSGEVVSLFSDETQRASQSLLNFSSLTIYFTTTLILVSICLTISLKLTFVAFAVLSVLLMPFLLLNRFFVRHGEQLSSYWERVSSDLLDSIRNKFYISIYDLQEKTVDSSESNLTEHLSIYAKTFRLLSIKDALPTFFGILTLIVIVYFHSKGSTEINNAQLITFFYLFLRASQNMSLVQSQYSQFLVNTVAVKNIQTYLSALSQPGIETTRTSSKKEVVNFIELSDVSFSYDDNRIFNNFNLKASTGDRYFIHGPSGSGKSTLLSLIIGLLKPNSGKIKVNSKPVDDHTFNIRSQIGYVGPMPYLVKGTIKENLLYAHPAPEKVDERDIFNCLKLANCDEFINFEASEINQIIDEQGSSFSTGQKQRLMIARALLRDPQVLILDEFTSNLDKETEEIIMDRILEIANDKILFIVSHKPHFLNYSNKEVRL